MKNAMLRAIADKASAIPAKAAAVASTPAPAAPETRKWSSRDYPAPAKKAKAKAEVRESIHYRIVTRTK